jgi:carboxypeptidase C (cathepsin A)
MHSRPGLFPSTLFVLVLTLPQVSAQEKGDKPEAKKPPLKDVAVTTNHKLEVGKVKLSYSATAGTLVLRDEDGKATASIFYISYVRTDVPGGPKRPVTFTFNGGPGSSSVWLHLGAFAPKRVHLTDEGHAPPPPYKLVDNEFTLLDQTDLVFIDPVTTGYSRMAPGQTGKQFHGVEQDIQSVGEFIRLWTTRNGRWDSPKFLAGESYGTTRAANLVSYMQDRHGMNFNGVILVSSILNFQTARFDDGNDLPYILFLPTYTATAWYHKKLPSELSLKEALKGAEEFALGEYTLALMKGNRLTDKERKTVAAKVAHFTGLSEDYVLRSNLRVPIQRFCKELLRDRGRTVGRFDTRYTGIDRDAAGETPEYDPSYAAVQGPYTAALNKYIRGELGFESDLPYEILTGRVQPWDYSNYQNRYLNVSDRLRQAMTKNPALRVFVANGYYDLATPYFATEYTFNHLNLAPALQKHITMGYYEAGHMMYVHKASHEQLKRDLTKFYQATPR